jgi:hypothetical protein
MKPGRVLSTFGLERTSALNGTDNYEYLFLLTRADVDVNYDV